jgi:uncharacterized membrane protein YoaK (UPF0700 family)
LIAMIAGMVDAYGIVVYRTYLSFMSGNTTQTGYETGQGNFSAAVLTVVAILSFVAGSFTGALFSPTRIRETQRRIFAAAAALLALVIVFKLLGHIPAGVHVAAASFAMGMMTLALSRVGAQPVSITFVTGTLSRLGVHLALALKGAPLPDSAGWWDSHLRRASILGSIWIGFLAGALIAGAAMPRLGVWILLLPVLILSALTVVRLRS